MLKKQTIWLGRASLSLEISMSTTTFVRDLDKRLKMPKMGVALLPEEMLRMIFPFLLPKDLKTAVLVGKAGRRLALLHDM